MHQFDAAINVVIYSLPLAERRFYRIYTLVALHLPAAGRSLANSTLAGFRLKLIDGLF